MYLGETKGFLTITGHWILTQSAQWKKGACQAFNDPTTNTLSQSFSFEWNNALCLGLSTLAQHVLGDQEQIKMMMKVENMMRVDQESENQRRIVRPDTSHVRAVKRKLIRHEPAGGNASAMGFLSEEIES
ncbi:hypothetical protein EVAR_93948_1 [Eumeta japonica]|uniref:Uncharacterized protein n=1 Tax=Eumeta variegata TaxID=151549 RepID=A0A4C1TP72_EUMVA|nr:hypothetical protein EVAR_93948_1 [Eumeta japonica]